MSDTVYKFIGPDDLEEAARIYSDVYVYGLDAARRDIREDLEGGEGVQVPAAFVGGRLASILQIVDYTIHLGSNELSMGGIAGVATHAEDRRNRLVASLLKMSLERMRETGTLTSMLYPFSYAFYRKYGWEHACDALQIKTKVKDLHSLREWSKDSSGNAAKGGRQTTAAGRSEFARLDIGPIDQMDLGSLKPVYSTYYSKYNCAVVRGEREWERFRHNISKSIASGTNNYVYLGSRDGQPVSYIAYTFRKNPDEGRTLWIREAAAIDGAAWMDVLGFIARHDAQAVDLEGIVPLDSPLRTFLAEPGKMRIAPHLMFRIVDVARFISSLAACGAPDGVFTMGVSDRTCEWNDKVFAITAEGGRVSAAPALHGEADIHLDIAVLSQIASGYLPAAAAARAGLVAVSDLRSLEMLERMLPAKTTFSTDYF